MSMDNLQHILGGRSFEPPAEIDLIKDYIKRRYRANCRVEIRDREITINVKSAPLANELRLNQAHLKETCNVHKRLVIRIG